MGCGRVWPRVPGTASALALLVAQVVADDHDPPVTADHLALRADALDARLDLHVLLFLRGAHRGRTPAGSLVAVDDPAARQVVRRQLHDDLVLGEDPDVVLTHLA